MVAIVLTVYGIETRCSLYFKAFSDKVAIVLTVYGIETLNIAEHSLNTKLQ